METYQDFFKKATGFDPFPYQVRLAESEFPQVLNVPTGAGKTAAVILAWLWKRRFADEGARKSTPRRLVYCLPMRVLVEQTRDEAEKWLKKLGLLAEKPGDGGEDKIAVTVLMGGEDTDKWDYCPERDAIIIGTQDMLLSRALNRGYAMSRYRWPVHYALLNNDCLWIMDEVQLMGVGVETSAQMQAFREKLGCKGNTKTIWMSATVGEDELDTVDHPKPASGFLTHDLRKEDLAHELLAERFNATKKIARCRASLTSKTDEEKYAESVAKLLLEKRKAGTLVLCVLNRVKRAQDVYKAVKKHIEESGLEDKVKTAVIHSRFREGDRAKKTDFLLKTLEDRQICRIVVSTQVVEAGVDVSAHTIITELAPWPSMVQRFGRCNRYGEYDDAAIEWIDIIPKDEKDDISLPYELEELEKSRKLLTDLKDASPKLLKNKSTEYVPPMIIRSVIRRKDVLDLFDTTPDLSGNDLDVSRFIRDDTDKDVQVFWRKFEDPNKPNNVQLNPVREELCSVSISEANKYAKEQKGWIWDPLEERWRAVGKGGETSRFHPGQVVLLNSQNGGYTEERGWIGLSEKPSEVPIIEDANAVENEYYSRDDVQAGMWVTLNEHTNDVVKETSLLIQRVDVPESERNAVEKASKWHDVGKAHDVFQKMICKDIPQEKATLNELWAKRGGSKNTRTHYGRKCFRHELASALAWLQNDGKNDPDGSLVAYLIASHHGKVRLSIRSLPNEGPLPPGDDTLFARGIWHGDPLPRVPDIMPSETILDLTPMQLGEGSWLERTLNLRDDPEIGPFRLSFLEAILRIADWRASEKEERKEA